MITTFTGKTVNPFRIKKEDICIEDIAHALSQINRFNGHARFPINVAQHSLYVSRLSKGAELEGLLHDAAEAYIGDITKWLKQTEAMSAYRDLEYEIQHHINWKFGIERVGMSDVVKEADEIMVRFEAREAFGDSFDFGGMAHKYPPITKYERNAIGVWSPFDHTDSEHLFLKEFERLTNAKLS